MVGVREAIETQDSRSLIRLLRYSLARTPPSTFLFLEYNHFVKERRHTAENRKGAEGKSLPKHF